jgi:hypothetical protein
MTVARSVDDVVTIRPPADKNASKRLWAERNELHSELAKLREDEHILDETLVTAQRTAERARRRRRGARD